MTNNLLIVFTGASVKLAQVRCADRSQCKEQCEAVLAESVEAGDEDEIAFFFVCLPYKISSVFRNGPVHEFYGLKASQMSKVRASSH